MSVVRHTAQGAEGLAEFMRLRPQLHGAANEHRGRGWKLPLRAQPFPQPAAGLGCMLCTTAAPSAGLQQRC